jgi:adenylate cyclase
MPGIQYLTIYINEGSLIVDLVWLGMPEGHLPTPGNLTGEEVELILDPSASGVPELSPVLTMRRRIEASEKRVKELEGEERLVAKSMLACSLAHFDTPRAIMLVEEVLDAAKANDSVLAQAAGFRAKARLPWYIVGITLDEHRNDVLTAMELFSHLHLDLYKADMMLQRARASFGLAEGAKRAVEDIWEARSYAVLPRSGDDEYLRHRVLGFAAFVLSMIASQIERSAVLARQYAAIAILHIRLTEELNLVGAVHSEIAAQLGDQSDYSGALGHHLRSARIFRHHEAWNQHLLALQKAAIKQLQLGQVENAERSLGNLKQLSSEHSLESNKFSVELVQGRIHLAKEEWESAITLLAPLVEMEAATTITKAEVAKYVALAYEKLERFAESTYMLKRATGYQEQYYEDRLQGRMARLSIAEEMQHLKDKLGRNDATLRAILPATAHDSIANTGACEARYFDGVAIFYSDFVGFTRIASGIPPRQLMDTLGELFDQFDSIMAKNKCERIDVIGDAYLAVAGLDGGVDVVNRIARAALDIIDYLTERNRRQRSLGAPEFIARIGLHVGSIVGGMVGGERLRYAIFGDAVNTAQRLEAGGEPGEITVSEEAAHLLEVFDGISLELRAPIVAKGKGLIPAWVARRTT